jgi:hypothetical protein
MGAAAGRRPCACMTLAKRAYAVAEAATGR